MTDVFHLDIRRQKLNDFYGAADNEDAQKAYETAYILASSHTTHEFVKFYAAEVATQLEEYDQDEEKEILKPYILNAIYAAHLDTKNDTEDMHRSMFRADMILEKIVAADPQIAYDSFVAADILKEVKDDGQNPQPQTIRLGRTLNSYAVTGLVNAKDLAGVYDGMVDSSAKTDMTQDLQKKLAIAPPKVARQFFVSSKDTTQHFATLASIAAKSDYNLK